MEHVRISEKGWTVINNKSLARRVAFSIMQNNNNMEEVQEIQQYIKTMMASYESEAEGYAQETGDDEMSNVAYAKATALKELLAYIEELQNKYNV